MYKFANDTCQELIDDIRDLFFKSDMNQIEFAKDIGIAFETLKRFMKGEKIYLNSLRKIVNYAEKHKNNKKNKNK